jgi:hypothetical protein
MTHLNGVSAKYTQTIISILQDRFTRFLRGSLARMLMFAAIRYWFISTIRENWLKLMVGWFLENAVRITVTIHRKKQGTL